MAYENPQEQTIEWGIEELWKLVNEVKWEHREVVWPHEKNEWEYGGEESE